MKKLIYFSFAFMVILMAASCKKDDISVKPVTLAPSEDSPGTVSLINNSGNAYEAAFEGMTKFTVDMQAYSRHSITVKAGNYSVQVYPISSYSVRTISWSGIPSVTSARTSFTVLIKPADQQSLLIY